MLANNIETKTAVNSIEKQQTLRPEAELIRAMEKLRQTLESVAGVIKATDQNEPVEMAEVETYSQAALQKSLNEIIEKIQKFIEVDDLEQACETIKEQLDQNQGILFKRNLYSIEEGEKRGTILSEEYQVARSKLANRILQWLKRHTEYSQEI